MPNSTFNQITRLVFLLSIGGFFGYQLGSFFVGILFILLIEVISQIYFFNKLTLWLNEGPSSDIPSANNLWSSLMNNLYKVINKLKKEKSQLKANIDYFQESFQVIDDAVIIVNDRNSIVWVNDSSSSIFGINLKEDEGELITNLIRDPDFISYIHSDDFSSSIIIPTVLQKEKRIKIKATKFHKNHILIFASDITETIKLEEMRRDFVSNVSHELKTPLTVISGYLEALRDCDVSSSENTSKAISDMIHQSERMDKIIQDLILLSKLENTNLVKEHNFFSIVELIESVVSDLHILDDSKSVEVEYMDQFNNKLNSDDLNGFQIKASYQELRSVFINLAENAFKYSPQNSHLIISLVLDRDLFIVRFKDDGFGFDTKHIPRLTERFYRVDPSRSSERGGTGLGLSIVKHILNNHNATLEIESELGVGSTFSCIFPSEILSDQEKS